MITTQQHVRTDPQTVTALVQDWQLRWPGMGVLMLLPEAEQAQLGGLQAVFREAGVPLAGAIFPALLTDQGFATEGAWLICLHPMPVYFLLDDIQNSGAQRMAEAVEAVLHHSGDRPQGGRHTFFMVFDGMVPNIGTLLSELHTLQRSPLHYGGVNAGSETFQPMPCLFDAHRRVGDGALGLLLPPSSQVVVRHGYPVSRCLMQATSSTGNRIDTIDHRPAFEVYQEVIGREYGVTLTRDNFYEHAVHFPFGIVMAVDVLVRIPVALSDDGSLFCVGEVPSNSMLRLLKAPKLEDSDCVATIVEHLADCGMALQANAGPVFYCAGRRMHFGAHADREIQQLAQATGRSALFGALTLGEIDTVEDLNMPRFHNAAVVCLAY